MQRNYEAKKQREFENLIEKTSSERTRPRKAVVSCYFCHKRMNYDPGRETRRSVTNFAPTTRVPLLILDNRRLTFRNFSKHLLYSGSTLMLLACFRKKKYVYNSLSKLRRPWGSAGIRVSFGGFANYRATSRRSTQKRRSFEVELKSVATKSAWLLKRAALIAIFTSDGCVNNSMIKTRGERNLRWRPGDSWASSLH